MYILKTGCAWTLGLRVVSGLPAQSEEEKPNDVMMRGHLFYVQLQLVAWWN